MKLATLKDSTRDGRLVVVSKDLTRCSEVGHIARTLQAALDDWSHVAPRLFRVAQGIETGSQPTMRFHEHDATSPLPRGFVWQGGSGGFTAPRDAVSVPSSAADLSVTAQVAVITGDVGSSNSDDDRGAVLVLLASDVAAGNESIASTFSPVAVTPDELGDSWQGGELALAVRRNGDALDIGRTSGADVDAIIEKAAARRALIAGSILSTGLGLTQSPLSAGDTIRIEMKDRTGHSIFGAIEQSL